MPRRQTDTVLPEKAKFPLMAAGILLIYIIVQIVLLQTSMHSYDSYRDLIVAKELAQRGTLSYFGNAYVINPPLSYVMRTGVIASFGFSLLSQKLLNILMYFSGALFIYMGAKTFMERKKARYVFILSSLSWTFILATRIRSYSYMMLFSSLIIYSYFRYLNDPSERTAILVGAALGLGMLTKASFAFLVLILSAHHLMRVKNSGGWNEIEHHLIFGLTALTLYLPYLIYLLVNRLPLPWSAETMQATAGAGWAGSFTAGPLTVLYQEISTTYPILVVFTIGGIFLFIRDDNKHLYSPLGFLALLITTGPLLARLVLDKVHLYQTFFLFLPLPLFTVWTAGQLADRYQTDSWRQIGNISINPFTATVALACVLATFHGSISIIERASPPENYFSDSFEDFIDDLDQEDVVLSEHKATKMHALSEAYVEQADGLNETRLLYYNADYYIADKEIDEPYLGAIRSINVSGKQMQVHAVDQEHLVGRRNLTADHLTARNADGNTVSHTICITKGDGWRHRQESDMDGNIRLLHPSSGSTDNMTIHCQSMGYEAFRTDGLAATINLGDRNSFLHRFARTRY